MHSRKKGSTRKQLYTFTSSSVWTAVTANSVRCDSAKNLEDDYKYSFVYLLSFSPWVYLFIIYRGIRRSKVLQIVIYYEAHKTNINKAAIIISITLNIIFINNQVTI
jgi:hypothetical protein